MVFAILEINTPISGVVELGQIEDAGYRGAGLALAAAPFLYIAAVPVCYAVGSLLASLGLRRLFGFLAGTVGVALFLGLIVGLILSAPSRFGLGDVVLSVAVSVTLLLVTTLPAAVCWWFIALRPYSR
jgi:hypothetical protein